MASKKQMPVTRQCWMQYYVNHYNKHGDTQSAILAMWYHFLILKDEV